MPRVCCCSCSATSLLSFGTRPLCCILDQYLKADLKRCEAVVRDVDVTVENISSDSAETDMKVSFTMHIAYGIRSSENVSASSEYLEYKSICCDSIVVGAAI